MREAIGDLKRLPVAVAAEVSALLSPGEPVQVVISGLGDRNAVVVTDRRILMTKYGKSSSWPLDEIDAVEWGTGVIRWVWVLAHGPRGNKPKFLNLPMHPCAMQVSAEDFAEERAEIDAIVASARRASGASAPAATGATESTADESPADAEDAPEIDPSAVRTAHEESMTNAPATAPMGLILEVAPPLPAPTRRRAGEIPQSVLAPTGHASVDYRRHPLAVAGQKPWAEYTVNYRGGLPEYPKSSSAGLKLRVWPGGFEILPRSGRKFAALLIPIETVVGVELAQRTVSAFEGILGGLDSRQLNQANNIHIAFWRNGIELVLRLEMLTGTFVMTQAGKSRDFMDLLRTHGMIARIEANKRGVADAWGPREGASRAPQPETTRVVPSAAAASAAASHLDAEDIPAAIRALAALRDDGILSDHEFEAKKSDLLNRM